MSQIITKSLQSARKAFIWTPVNASWAWTTHLGDERDPGIDIGDGSSSSLVEACISWVANALTQTRPTVINYGQDGEFGEPRHDHPLARLIRRPTYDPASLRSFYSWIPLIKATVMSLDISADAYWRKRRSATGKVVQLWFYPTHMVQPVREAGSRKFVDYYRISSGLGTDRVRPQDIVHFRDGLSEDGLTGGMSKVEKVLREIGTDERAAAWTSTLLYRQAVPGLILSPEGPSEPMSEQEAKEVKERLDNDFTGENRGRSMILGAPTKVQQYGFSPEQMKLGDLRDVPEERVSMVLGIPAAVVGAGAGMQSTKVGATMAELVDLAWQNGVLPRARLIAAEITEQLMGDFDDSGDLEFAFDTSRVPIMADYHDKLAQKHERLFKSSLEQRAEGRRALGLRATKDDEIYAVQAGVTFARPDGTAQIEEEPEPEPLPAPAEPLALPAGAPAKTLTPRERKVALLIGLGRTNKLIAHELGVGERTIERDISSALARIGAESRVALGVYALKPFGGFEDFQDCVNHMTDQGKDEESARRICGAMQAEAE